MLLASIFRTKEALRSSKGFRSPTELNGLMNTAKKTVLVAGQIRVIPSSLWEFARSAYSLQLISTLSVGLNRLLESINLEFCWRKMTWRSALNIARTQADRKDCENVHPGA